MAEKRSVLYDTNRVAKVLMLIGSSMVAIYLMFIAVLLAFVSFNIRQQTACSFFFGIMPFLLVLDFLVRILAQRTPAQMVKPYILLPLCRYDCVDCFIISSIFTPNNLLWMFLTVPYSIMAVVFNVGFIPAVSFIVTVQFVFVCNSLFYMLCRTLFSAKVYWAIIPVSVYVLMFLPALVWDFDTFFSFYGVFGEWASSFNPAAYVCVLGVLLLLFWANRLVQYKYVNAETQSDKEVQLKSISSFSFFEKFGGIGETYYFCKKIV